MQARILVIEEKRKNDPGAVRPSDFKVRDGGAIDPQVILHHPHITLYCLDFENRQALFVETAPECDLSRAPFLYQAQYEAATRLIQVPWDTLHRLADEVVIDSSQLILIYSVGRCGSTLVSRAFAEIEGVDSLSEPDVFTQMLATWGPQDLGGGDKADLVKSCTLLQCAPGRIKGATVWALKFRSMVTEMGPMFYSLFPAAKVIFLYRNAEPWLRSMLRMAGRADPSVPVPLEEVRALFGRAVGGFDSRETATSLELFATLWQSVMEKCQEMQRRGVPMFVARYEELNTAPGDVLAQMFAYCGLASREIGNLSAVLEQDSQAGTALSRASLGAAPANVTREHLEELRRLIHDNSPELAADTILPGTYFPATQNSSSAS